MLLLPGTGGCREALLGDLEFMGKSSATAISQKSAQGFNGSALINIF